MSALTGAPALSRFVVRRDRVLMPLWIVLIGILPLVYASAIKGLYDTAASRESLARSIMENPSESALVGPVFGSSTGGLVTWRAGISLLIIAIINVLVVIRHTRTEEDDGRRELVGSAAVGRQAGLTAAVFTTMLADLLLGVLAALALISQGLPASGSIAFGLASTGVGWTFAAIGAFTAQLTESASAARGIAIGLVGLAFLLRAAGDSSGAGGSVRWLSWLSPIGWGQQLRAYEHERWWVLLLALAFTAIVLAGAFALSAHRDVGAGLFRPRPGRPTAPRSLSGATGLAWRLQRVSFFGWIIGFVVIGGVAGSVAKQAASQIASSPAMLKALAQLGGPGAVGEAVLGAMFNLGALAATAYGISAALKVRTEETHDRAEPLLATALSRVRWAASHLWFAFLGPALALVLAGVLAGLVFRTPDGRSEVGNVLAGALVQIPAAWVLIGIAVLGIGLLPRMAWLAWGALLICVLLGQIGAILQLPQGLLDISPYTHVPHLPGGTFHLLPMIVMVVVAAGFVVVGLAGLRRRNIPA